MKRLLAGVAVAGAVLIGMAGTAVAEDGSQTFDLWGSGAEATVVASGPISGVGEDIENEAAEEGMFIFDDGTVTVDHPATEDDFEFNEVACFGRASFAGTYSLRDGTGAYAGVTGEGTYRGRAFFLAKRNADGSCSDEPEFDFFFVHAQGTTHTP